MPLRTWPKLIRAAMPLSLRRYLHRVGNYLNDWMYLDTLRQHGFDPRFMVDVGAYHGEWTQFAKRLFPNTGVLMVEAQTAKQARLLQLARQLGSVELSAALLGAEDGIIVPFFEMETGSSVFVEGQAEGRSRIELSTQRLDRVLADCGKSETPIDLMKLDVQGYELEVLKGAEQALARTEIIVAEASIMQINQGCPLIRDVIECLSQRDFVLIDLGAQVRFANQALWQTDLLFARTESRYRLRSGRKIAERN
jgi:FkbM family methyltransferase